MGVIAIYGCVFVLCVGVCIFGHKLTDVYHKSWEKEGSSDNYMEYLFVGWASYMIYIMGLLGAIPMGLCFILILVQTIMK